MSASVTHTTTDGHASLLLASPNGRLQATYAPGAGMVCCSLQHDGVELLGQRGGLATYVARGSTFGIPLLYPWANRLSALAYSAAGRDVLIDPAISPVRRDANGLPIHGLLAACPHWQVTKAAPHGKTAVLQAQLDFGAHRDLMAAFPFPHTLEMDVRLGDTGLGITTTVTPTGSAAVPVAFGFHPYLALPGGARDGVHITLPIEQHALLDDRGLPTGACAAVAPKTVPLHEQSYDDLFDRLTPSPCFTLSGPGRDVSVAFGEGYPVAQVYAPADQPFVCFEPMTAPTDALVSGLGLRTVAPGDVFRAGFRIDIGAAAARQGASEGLHR